MMLRYQQNRQEVDIVISHTELNKSSHLLLLHVDTVHTYSGSIHMYQQNILETAPISNIKEAKYMCIYKTRWKPQRCSADSRVYLYMLGPHVTNEKYWVFDI